ncbi:hypothetical protein CSB37_04290 [bacterium DOLZORAL124_38_8]|nr:MAG: hypothetical protein CSB37_04290 [bacterium DOLZORAL124_38_8]
MEKNLNPDIIEHRVSMIKKSKTFSGLAHCIRKCANDNGQIVSSSNVYDVEELAKNLEACDKNPILIHGFSVPNLYGIRSHIDFLIQHWEEKKLRSEGRLTHSGHLKEE